MTTFRRFLAILGVSALWATAPSQANVLRDIGHSIGHLWGQKSQKQHNARQARQQAANNEVRAAALHDRLEATQQLLQSATDNYYTTWQQMKRTQSQFVATRQRVRVVQARYQTHQEQFGRRLAAMQEYGQPSYLQIFLGSKSLSDLTRRTAFFQALAERDARLQSDLKADRAELQQTQNSLMAQWAERNELQLAANQERERVASAARVQFALLRQLRNSRFAQLAYAAAQDESSREIGSMIGSLQARRGQIIASYEVQERSAAYVPRVRYRYARQNRYARARLARSAGFRLAPPMHLTQWNGQFQAPQLAPMPIEALQPPEKTGESAHDASSDAAWEMPVRGRFSSRFGMRFHPILHRVKMHTGQDIAAAYGTAFRAAKSGRVLWAGWKKAYGNTVIVDNGDGLTTLYGHASKLGVKAGQPIAKGEYLGNVGSTGFSTGPHLHFEVRKNGQPVDPRGYLR